MKSVVRRQILPLASRFTSRPPVHGKGRILILQPDHLGDILLSEPAVRFLRARRPEAELIAVVGPWAAEICRMAWPVDQIVEVVFPGFTRSPDRPGKTAPYRLLQEQVHRLRNFEADDAIILRDDAWWAAWLAHGSVGGRIVTSDDPRLAPFAEDCAATSHHIHRTRIAMAIIQSYLGGDLAADASADWDMSPRLQAAGRVSHQSGGSARGARSASRRIVFHPGSGAIVKTWPVRYWRMVAKRLDGWEIMLTGTASEREMCEAIASGLAHVSNMAGETSLHDLADLLHNSRLAVGTDNGPIHLAGALGTPTVRLFGPSNPERYGPYPGAPDQTVVTANWSCERCEDLTPSRARGCGCMIAITPERVVQAIRRRTDDRS